MQISPGLAFLLQAFVAISFLSLVRASAVKNGAQQCASALFAVLFGLILFGAESLHFQPMYGQTSQDDTDSLLTWFTFLVCVIFASLSSCFLSDDPEKTGACVVFAFVCCSSFYLSFLVAYKPRTRNEVGVDKATLIGFVASSFVTVLCGWGLFLAFLAISTKYALMTLIAYVTAVTLIALRMVEPGMLLAIFTVLSLVYTLITAPGTCATVIVIISPHLRVRVCICVCVCYVV